MRTMEENIHDKAQEIIDMTNEHLMNHELLARIREKARQIKQDLEKGDTL